MLEEREGRRPYLRGQDKAPPKTFWVRRKRKSRPETGFELIEMEPHDPNNLILILASAFLSEHFDPPQLR